MRLSTFLSLSVAAFSLAAVPCVADIVISKAPTANMSCSAGVCSPTAADAVLNVQDLANLLASGNATVTSTGAGVQATNVRVDARLEWSAATTLALDAFHSIEFHRRVTVAGTGAVSLNTNDGGSGGEFWCSDTGRLQFNNLSSALTINGTPYTLVNNVATLASGIAANPSGAFALANNYNAKKDGTYVTSPVPTVFSGAFNGLGNTISNLSINDPTQNAYVGLFSETTGAVIANVRLINETVQGGSGSSLETGSFIGGLVGYGGGSIAHSFTSGSVSGGAYVSVGGLAGLGGISVAASASSATVSTAGLGNAGGLVGGTSAPISDSYATGSVSGVGFVGGMVGFYSGLSVKNSWASATVSSSDSSTYVGGLVGIDQYGVIERSYAAGAVTCQFACGGLIGVLGLGDGGTPKVSQSFATASVTGGGPGGLVGYNENGAISNSYSTGAVSGQLGAGGLVGQNNNANQNGSRSIAHCYAAGAVSSESGPMGGLVGYDQFASTMKRNYWDMTTSGITDPSQGAGNVANDPGISGLSDSQLKSGLPRGFSTKIWNEDSNINGGLPYLIANRPQS